MSEEQLERIERAVSENTKNIGRLFTAIEAVVTHRGVWSETVCEVHSKGLSRLQDKCDDVDGDIVELRLVAGNRWPTLFAAFAGGMTAIVPVTLAYFKFVHPFLQNLKAGE